MFSLQVGLSTAIPQNVTEELLAPEGARLKFKVTLCVWKKCGFFLKKPCLKFDKMTQTFEGIFFYLLYFTGLGDTVLELQMASFAIIGLTTTSTIWFICCKQDDDENNPEGCQ